MEEIVFASFGLLSDLLALSLLLVLIISDASCSSLRDKFALSISSKVSLFRSDPVGFVASAGPKYCP